MVQKSSGKRIHQLQLFQCQRLETLSIIWDAFVIEKQKKKHCPWLFQIHTACAMVAWHGPVRGLAWSLRWMKEELEKKVSKPSSWPPRTQQLRFILSGKWDYPEDLWLQGRTPNIHWRVFLPGPLCHAICNDIERGGCRDTWRLTSSGQFAHKRKRQVSRSPQMTAQPQSLFPDTGLWQSKMC